MNWNLQTVEYYHIEAKFWSLLPELNQAISAGNSCCHGSYMYVFGGASNYDGSSNSSNDDDDNVYNVLMNTIERINLDEAVTWELI